MLQNLYYHLEYKAFSLDEMSELCQLFGYF